MELKSILLKSIKEGMGTNSWALQDISTLLDHNAEDIRIMIDQSDIASDNLKIKAEKIGAYKNSLISIVNDLARYECSLLEISKSMK